MGATNETQLDDMKSRCALLVIDMQLVAFDGTNLAEVLGGLGNGTVLVCGIWSEHCVASTSIDALELGFRVVVAGDGHGTVAPTVGEARQVVRLQNRRLKEAGASVCTVSELLGQEAVSLPGLGSSLAREP